MQPTTSLPVSKGGERLPSGRAAVLELLLRERQTHAAVLADRDRLLAVFSHDLKNLMNALVLNGHSRSRRRDDPPSGNDDVSWHVLVRMDRLISNLLDLTRVNAGKLRVIPEPCSASALLKETVTIFRPLADEKRITLALSLPDDDLRASLDHDRVFQVLSNLLINAIKFSQNEGRVAVSARRTGDLLEVEVQDSGDGIEDEDLERVFDVYRQMSDTHLEGLGLGLFIARSIVEAHGGRIGVRSRPGLGSTFFFTIPALAPFATE